MPLFFFFIWFVRENSSSLTKYEKLARLFSFLFSPQATKCVIQTDAPHRKMFGNIITLMANFFPSQINLSSFNLFLLLYSYIAYMYRIWLLVFQFVYMDVSISVGLRCFYAFFFKFVCQVGNVCIEPSRPFSYCRWISIYYFISG